MKTPRYFAILASLMTVFACSELNQNTEKDTAFTVSETSLTFSFEGGEQTFTLTAPDEWYVMSSNTEWCTATPDHGFGKATVTVKVQALPSDQDPGRSTRLLVVAGTLTLSVTIVQECNPDIFVISPSKVSLNCLESDFSITVLSPTKEFDITIVDDWITEVSRSGKPATGETIEFHATGNLSDNASPRTGVISVCTKDGSCYPVMIEQAGALSRKILGMRFTATWCGYCPYMDEAFHSAYEQSEDFTFITFHASAGYPLYFSDSQTLAQKYNVSGFPTGVLAGWKEIKNYTNTATTVNFILNNMDTFKTKFPVASGINATAAIKDDKIAVDATITTGEQGEYHVVAVLMESGIVQAQQYYPTSGGSQTLSDFVHDNVARKTLSGSIVGDIIEGSDQVHWETDLDSSWNKDNLSVMIWVTKNYGTLAPYKAVKSYPSYYVDNACCVKVGQ